METSDLIFAFAASFVAAATQSFAGFGYGLTVVPLMSLFLGPRNAVIVANVLAMLLPTFMMVLLYRHVNWRLGGRLAIAALAGLPLGFLLIWYAPVAGLQILISIVILVAVVAMLRGLTISRHSLALDGATGLVSGMLKSSTSMSGPPVVLYLQGRGLERIAFRATLAAYFAFTSVVTVIVFTVAGDLDSETLKLVAAGVPGLLAGIGAGEILQGRVNDVWFRRVVLLVLVASALLGILRAM